MTVLSRQMSGLRHVAPRCLGRTSIARVSAWTFASLLAVLYFTVRHGAVTVMQDGPIDASAMMASPERCWCKDEKTRRVHDFCYGGSDKNIAQVTSSSLAFDCAWLPHLHRLDLLNEYDGVPVSVFNKEKKKARRGYEKGEKHPRSHTNDHTGHRVAENTARKGDTKKRGVDRAMHEEGDKPRYIEDPRRRHGKDHPRRDDDHQRRWLHPNRLSDWLEKDGRGRHRQIAYVMAASDNHITEALRTIENHQHINSGQKVIFYDIGLTARQVKLVQHICTVEYRRFKFEIYPEYVRRNFEYRWKPLILAEVLQEYAGAWWMDTSVFWNPETNLTEVTSGMLESMGVTEKRHPDSWKAKSPWLSILRAGHSIFAATHPKTYDYFGDSVLSSPTLKHMQQTEMFASGLMLITRSPETTTIMRWWVLCALQYDCQAPKGTTLGLIGCTFAGEYYTRYANCHVFDQSTINIIMSTMNHYRDSRYHSTLEVEEPKILYNTIGTNGVIERVTRTKCEPADTPDVQHSPQSASGNLEKVTL